MILAREMLKIAKMEKLEEFIKKEAKSGRVSCRCIGLDDYQIRDLESSGYVVETKIETRGNSNVKVSNVSWDVI